MLQHRNTELQIVKLANLVLMLNMVSKGKCQHCGIADVNHVTDIGVADDIADANVVDVADVVDGLRVSVCIVCLCAVCPPPPQPSTLLRSTSGCPVGEKSHDLF